MSEFICIVLHKVQVLFLDKLYAPNELNFMLDQHCGNVLFP